MTDDELTAWRAKVVTGAETSLPRTSVLSVIDELLRLRAERTQVSAVLQDKLQEIAPSAKRTYVIVYKTFRWDNETNQRISIEAHSKRFSAHAPVTSKIKRHPESYAAVIEYVEVEYKRISPQDWLAGNR